MPNTVRWPRRWSAAAIACACVLAACDDDPVGSIAGMENCEPVRFSVQTMEDEFRAGKARVRVNIVSRAGVEGNSRDFVELRGVSLYQGSRCSGLARSSQTALAMAENDVGALVAEAMVEPGTITHLQLVPGTGASARKLKTDKLTLPSPVALEEGTRHEFFVALDRVDGSDELAPRFVASGAVALDAGTVLVYEPGRGSAVSVDGAYTLDVGAGSMVNPGVFGIVEHRLGGVASLISIAPNAELGRAARITFPIDRTRIPTGMTTSDYGGFVGAQRGLVEVNGNTVTMDVASLGDVRLASDVPSVELLDGTRWRTPEPAGGPAASERPVGALVDNECSRFLAANRAYYFDLLSRNVGVKISDCETRDPYVHIIMVNLRYGAPSSYPRIQIPNQRYGNEYLLKTLSQHVSSVGAWAAVNGFMWDGADGTGPGQYGIPIGTVRINGVTASPYYSGAEAIIGFTQSSTTGGTTGAFFDKVAGNSIAWGIYGYNAVPSTTSIIKNNACSRTPGGEYKPFSAMGIGNGTLVLVSNVSGYSSEAYDLCGVFEGLNVLGGAIRLDGGPSTAIYWGGSGTTGVLNPLTNYLYTAKYGSYRHIPYAVAATY